MDLNSIFDEAESEAPVRQAIPFVPYLKKDSKEHLAIRFLQPLSEMQKHADISHYVQGVGKVKCAKKPIVNKETGLVYMWDGYSKKQGKMLNPEFDCVFCKEKFEAMDELTARTAKAKEDGTTPPTKEEGTKVNQMHDLKRQVIAAVEWRLQKREGKKVVPTTEWEQGWLQLRVTDLFSPNGKGFWKQLKEMSEEETLLEHIWILKPSSLVLEKDAAIDGEPPEVELDREALLNMVKSYEVGSEKYLANKNKANQGVKRNETTEQKAEQNTSVVGESEDDIGDDELPF